MNIAYRISTAVLGLGAILCAFFLKFFNFTITAIIVTKSYSYSIYEAIGQLSSKGISTSSDNSKVLEVLEPMLNSAITFFVLVAVACLMALAITVISSVSNLHVPQAILSGVGFILLVIAAGFGTNALNCLVAPDSETAAAVPLSSIVAATVGEVTTENALSTLGSAISKVQIAALSYGFYIVMAIFAVIFIWTLIANHLYHDDQPKKTGKKHRREYRRKKPMRKLSTLGK